MIVIAIIIDIVIAFMKVNSFVLVRYYDYCYYVGYYYGWGVPFFKPF